MADYMTEQNHRMSMKMLEQQGEINELRQRAEQAEAAIERVRRFSELVINGSIRVQAIHQARDTLTVLNGEELKDPVIEAERDEAEQRIGRLADQLVAEREKRRGAETAITRARALHHDDQGLCAECTNAVGVPWPCDTARALDGETT